jgi:hypothetical protein
VNRLAVALGILVLGLVGFERCGIRILSDEATSCERPAFAVPVALGQSLQAAVDAHPEGTKFLLAAGVHRLQTVQPKPGNAFYGARDANCRRLSFLSGARPLTSFERVDALFVARGQTQQGTLHGVCRQGWERCQRPEDLYFDDEPLRHVGSLEELAPGRWHFDYDDDAIYFVDDPEGRRVETSVSRVAFSPTAPDVTVNGLVVEKYATPAQRGAIGGQYPQTRWTIEDNEVRLNHGIGINLGSESVAARNHVHHNGQLGIGGRGAGLLIEANEIAYNNYANFLPPWEAGGTKFSWTTGLVARGNCVHDNFGSGLWTDTDNSDTLYEANVVFRNAGQGIFHEISGNAVIRDNRVGRNGEVGEWLYGTNILISTSHDVEVVGNRVETAASFGNAIGVIWQERGDGYTATGNQVHDNEVTFLGPGGLSGAAADFDPGWVEVFESNVFDENLYHMAALSEAHFAWNNAEQSFAAFQAAGMELHGAADTAVEEILWDCDEP